MSRKQIDRQVPMTPGDVCAHNLDSAMKRLYAFMHNWSTRQKSAQRHVRLLSTFDYVDAVHILNAVRICHRSRCVFAGAHLMYPFAPLFASHFDGYEAKMTEAATVLRSRSLRVVLVDDHALIRQGLRSLLEAAVGVEVSGEAGGLADALDVIQRSHPDVVLLDLRLGEEDGLDLARTCRESVSDVRILMLSAYGNSQQLHDAFAAGADGYLLKGATATELVDGLRRTALGETVIDPSLIPMLLESMQSGGGSEVLTARECELLGMVADGQTPQVAARCLGISLRTVQKHLENMHRKLGVASRAELIQQAFRRGLLQ